jgi:predicted kinase
MKSLSLSRPLIIMMVGYPGAGKSFFASQFADTFNSPRISIDRLRSDIFTNPTYAKEEDELIKRITDVQTQELLKTNKSFIVDGGCNLRTTRLEYERLARSKGYGTLVIWVQTDGPTCRIRATRRSNTRPGDIYNTPMTDETLAALVKRFNPPTASENSMVISGKHTYATQLRVVLKKLAPARESVEISSHPQTAQQRPHGDLPAKPRRVTIN